MIHRPRPHPAGKAKPRPLRPHPLRPRSLQRATGDPGVWLYGSHAVAAALANPARRLRRLLVLDPGRDDWQRLTPDDTLTVEGVERAFLESVLPAGAIHQGVALEADPLEAPSLEELLFQRAANGDPPACFVVLDQITDPHNVGAILRSAAGFGCDGVIMTQRHAPPLTGALAKAASGAVERVPVVRVVNLARALRLLQQHGITCLGLTGAAALTLDAALDGALGGGAPLSVALALGAEGDGLRRLTLEGCDLLARLPTLAEFGTLNVSNAAAIALYAVRMKGIR